MKIIDQGMNRETAIKAINENLAELGKGQRIDRGMNDKAVRSMLVAAGLPFNRRNRRAVLAGLNLVFSTPVATYLPTTPAPQFSVGMARLYPAYTGPAARVVRSTDGAALDIPTGPDLADMSGFDAFAGAADITVDTVYDQAAAINGQSARNHVQTTAANRPLMRRANAANNRQTISLGLNPNGGTLAQRFLREDTVANQRQSVTRVTAVLIPGGTTNSIPLWAVGQTSSGSDMLAMLYDTTGEKAALYPLTNNFETGMGGPPTGALAIIAYRSGPASQSLRVNGVERWNKPTPATNIALTGSYLGRTGWGGASVAAWDLFADIHYDQVLTDAQLIAVETALAAKAGVTLGVSPSLLAFEGDSMTAALNESGYHRGLPRLLTEALTAEGRVAPYMPNFGGGGGTFAGMNGTSNRLATATHALNKGATLAALHIWAGTNDILALTSGAIAGGATTLFNTVFVPYIQFMTDPSRFGSRVVVGTMIPRGWLGTSTDRAEREAERLIWNQLIRDNAATYGYTVADYGAIPELSGGPNGGNPNYPNLTYYGLNSDVHINGLGYLKCLERLLPIIRSWFY